MGNNSENYSAIISQFREKSAEARNAADKRRAELDAKFPEIAKIDTALESTGLKILLAATEGKKGLEARIAKLKQCNDELLECRAEFLKMHGYPEDYSDVHYECGLCSDTGYTKDGKMCSCLKKTIARANFERSGIAKLAEKQNFGTFDLNYYNGTARKAMSDVYESCVAYAENFDGKKMSNLLLIGKTGLGKTHLSSSVAKTVIERGFDVIYESAQNIIGDFEKEKFSRYDAVLPDTQKYFDCALLIIDDLGTEMSTQFTLACLYNLINTRLVSEKSMLISTNVGKKELLERYSERITSRLFGEFMICVFEGSDIRAMKLRK